MSVIINKITFMNYRQYGTGTLSFDTSSNGMLSVIIAKNGTGKTTILNAITWCLYGKELHLSDEKKALPVVTSDVVKNSDVDDLIQVEVSLTITDEDSIVEFKRVEAFKVAIDSFNNKHVIPGNNQLTATTTKIESFSNTEIKTGADADIIVKQYFDEAIFKFYFFDGEKLRDFFSATQANSIQQSIFNISQITLLENSCSRLRKMSSDRTKKIAKDSPDIAKLNHEQEKQEKTRAAAVLTYETNGELADSLSQEREKLDDLLRGYEPVKRLQEERDDLTKKNRKIDDEIKEHKLKKTAFIRKYLVLLNLYPRIKKTLEIIAEKEAAGDLPPAIDKELIKRLLEHPDQHCPICDSSIDETAVEHIQKMLTQFSVSSRTSNYLKEIKGTLEAAMEDVTKFKLNLDEINQIEMDIASRKQEVEKRLSEIASSLSGFENISGQVNVSEIEAKRSDVIYRINTANQAIGAAKETIKNCDAELASIEEKRNVALKKMDEHEDLRNQVSVIDMLYNSFKAIKSSIMNDMKKEIENITWSYFDRMIWKEKTFGRLEISDSYDIAVYNKDGTEMTGSLSATEQMALAYAFTLAIHEASGKNCPLVIDSPLGRVSDKNRENMAEALKEVSRTKQIIMLFTPDEYSEEVRSIYDGVASEKVFELSEDENYVEGIEH